MYTANSSDYLAKLSYGDHACLIYSDLKEYREVAADFIIGGLIGNEMVVCIIDEYPKELLIEDLRAKGIDAQQYIESGQLLVSSIKDAYAGNKGFKPDDTINYWKNKLNAIRNTKYNGIRGIGEALFALDGKQESIDKLIEYEIRCNLELLPYYKNQISLCVYNKNLFPLNVLEDIIKAHPVIINGTRVVKKNPYYRDSSKHLKEYNEKKSLRNFFNLDKDGNRNIEYQYNTPEQDKDIEILKYVLSATGDGVWEIDIASKQIYWNKSYLKAGIVTEKGLQGSLGEISTVIHPGDMMEFYRKLDMCCNNKIQHIEQEIRATGRDGETVWLMIKGVPIRKDENGQVLKMVGTFNNITEIKNTNIQLKKILKATADAILVVKEKEGVIHINQKYIDMWDMPKEFLKERNNKLLIEHVKSKIKDPEGFISNVEETIKSNEARVDILELVDGRIIERFYKPFILNGKDKYWVCSYRDVSERKRAESLGQEVVIKQKELQELRKYEQLKTEFFSTVSHELKTPLNVIFAATQILDSIRNGVKVSEKATSEKYIKIMRQNCYRLIRLINNLIDINKLESGFMKMELKNYDIVLAVENITQSVADYIKSKSIDIIFDTDIEEKIIACDADMIERVILNLLSNSVKFTREEGKIEVNIYDKGECIIISVKDNGIGIPEEMQGEIFERFKQVDSSLSRRAEGSGIGLSLVKSIVELHGGTIKVQSKIGEGSEFIIELPAKVIEDENTHEDEVAATSESYVERTLIEFSDIYS